MSKIKISTVVLLLFLGFPSMGQEASKLNIGLGVGIDYGGFGTRLTYLPVQRAGLFASVGYNLNSVGYNFGAQLRFPSEKRIGGHIAAMYGYNSVLIVEGTTTTKTTYYGFTGGLGLEVKFSRKMFVSFELLLPVRPKAYTDAIDDLKLIGFDIKEPPVVAFSLGVHYKFIKPE